MRKRERVLDFGAAELQRKWIKCPTVHPSSPSSLSKPHLKCLLHPHSAGMWGSASKDCAPGITERFKQVLFTLRANLKLLYQQ